MRLQCIRSWILIVLTSFCTAEIWHMKSVQMYWSHSKDKIRAFSSLPTCFAGDWMRQVSCAWLITMLRLETRITDTASTWSCTFIVLVALDDAVNSHFIFAFIKIMIIENFPPFVQFSRSIWDFNHICKWPTSLLDDENSIWSRSRPWVHLRRPWSWWMDPKQTSNDIEITFKKINYIHVKKWNTISFYSTKHFMKFLSLLINGQKRKNVRIFLIESEACDFFTYQEIFIFLHKLFYHSSNSASWSCCPITFHATTVTSTELTTHKRQENNN